MVGCCQLAWRELVRKLLFRLGIGFLFALFGLVSYYGNVSVNPVTGEKQHIQISPEQEVALGVQSREQLAQQFGGLYPDSSVQAYVDEVGTQVVRSSGALKSDYPFEFHALNDPQTINAFALPGGQIFITTALLKRLDSEAQLAGVLGHEVGHVVGRHGAEHLARQQLGAALVNAVGIAASESAQDGRQAAMIAQAVEQMVGLRYGRQDELESDRLGFQFMVESGYSPKGIVELMKILGSSRQGQQPPEFLSTHPDPGNRVEQLKALINDVFPQGIPNNLVEERDRYAQQVLRRL